MPMPVRSSRIGLYLRQKRLASGLTQVELAKRLGYATSQFVSNWEAGRSSPPLDAWAKLIDLLDLPQEEVVHLMVEETRKHLQEKLGAKRRRAKRSGLSGQRH